MLHYKTRDLTPTRVKLKPTIMLICISLHLNLGWINVWTPIILFYSYIINEVKLALHKTADRNVLQIAHFHCISESESSTSLFFETSMCISTFLSTCGCSLRCLNGDGEKLDQFLYLLANSQDAVVLSFYFAYWLLCTKCCVSHCLCLLAIKSYIDEQV